MKNLIGTVAILLHLCGSASAQDSGGIQFIKLLNEYRTGMGLNPVEWDPSLYQAAKLQSDWQLEADRCGHTQNHSVAENPVRFTAFNRLTEADPTWETRFNRYRVRENCGAYSSRGAGFRPEPLAGPPLIKLMFKAWVESPAHRAALLDPNVTHAAFSASSVTTQQPDQFLGINFWVFKSFSTCLLLEEEN